MRRLILYCLILSVLPAVRTELLYAEEVAKYLFDEGSGTTAIDISGKENHGTVVGSAYVEDTPFAYAGNYALEFHGTISPLVPAETYVTISDDPTLRPSSSLTIEAWIKASTVPANPYNSHIVTKQYGTSVQDSYALWHASDGTLRFGLDDGSPPITHLYSPISLDEWYHAVGVWDGSLALLYIDGIEVDSREFSGPIVYDGNPVLIGADDSNPDDLPDQVWNGIIDEVIIHNQALTAEEVLASSQTSAGIPHVIEATVDMDPDTLNLKSKGKWITCYVELPQDYDVAEVDIGTMLLNELASAESSPTEIGDYDNDEIPDLMVKFDRPAVQNILQVGDEVKITVSGELTDGTPFEGTDTIRVIAKGGKNK